MLKTNCEKCKRLVDPNTPHFEVECLTEQLADAKLEIDKLKASVDAWKNSWFQLRKLYGVFYWKYYYKLFGAK